MKTVNCFIIPGLLKPATDWRRDSEALVLSESSPGTRGATVDVPELRLSLPQTYPPDKRVLKPILHCLCWWSPDIPPVGCGGTSAPKGIVLASFQVCGCAVCMQAV